MPGSSKVHRKLCSSIDTAMTINPRQQKGWIFQCTTATDVERAPVRITWKTAFSAAIILKGHFGSHLQKVRAGGDNSLCTQSRGWWAHFSSMYSHSWKPVRIRHGKIFFHFDWCCGREAVPHVVRDVFGLGKNPKKWQKDLRIFKCTILYSQGALGWTHVSKVVLAEEFHRILFHVTRYEVCNAQCKNTLFSLKSVL